MAKVNVTLTFTFDAPDLIDACGGSVHTAKAYIEGAIKPHLDQVRELVAESAEEVNYLGEMIPTSCYTVTIG